MKILKGGEHDNAIKFLEEAKNEAQKALCERARCGTVIVSRDKIIGRGYNAPPKDDLAQKFCNEASYDFDKKPKSDKTCCVHAEWRAIMDALKNNPKEIESSRLYFTRVDEKGGIKKSGEPYCTICSRLALDTGIGEFVLFREEGVCVYGIDEYNRLSYGFHKKV